MSAVCQSSLSSRAATYPETRGICTSSTTASGIERKTVCTASTPSSAGTTSKPSRVSTEVTMRRRVGLSSAITTVGMSRNSSSADETADRLDELILVELRLQQISTCTGVQSGTLVLFAAPRGHDDARSLLPAAGPPNRAGQLETVHAGH